jgi:hypothetical protein
MIDTDRSLFVLKNYRNSIVDSNSSLSNSKNKKMNNQESNFAKAKVKKNII